MSTPPPVPAHADKACSNRLALSVIAQKITRGHDWLGMSPCSPSLAVLHRPFLWAVRDIQGGLVPQPLAANSLPRSVAWHPCSLTVRYEPAEPSRTRSMCSALLARGGLIVPHAASTVRVSPVGQPVCPADTLGFGGASVLCRLLATQWAAPMAKLSRLNCWPPAELSPPVHRWMC